MLIIGSIASLTRTEGDPMEVVGPSSSRANLPLVQWLFVGDTASLVCAAILTDTEGSGGRIREAL